MIYDSNAWTGRCGRLMLRCRASRFVTYLYIWRVCPDDQPHDMHKGIGFEIGRLPRKRFQWGAELQCGYRVHSLTWPFEMTRRGLFVRWRGWLLWLPFPRFVTGAA